MNWTIKTFDELTGKEIYEILTQVHGKGTGTQLMK